MKKFAVHRLSESARATLARHFVSLPAQDRSRRFGMALAPAVISAYVDQIDLDRDAVLGVHDERNALVGVAHVAIEDDHAEIGLSVLPTHRRRGIGSALFRRAIAYARARRMPRLLMHFLTANLPIVRMAQKFGMVIVANGSDADAFLDLQPASSAPPAAMRAQPRELTAVVRQADISTPPLLETHWTRILYYDLFSAHGGECGSDPAGTAASDFRPPAHCVHPKDGGMFVTAKESGRNNAPRRSGFTTQAAAIVLVVFVGLYLAVAGASHLGDRGAAFAPDRPELSASVGASQPPSIGPLDADSPLTQNVDQCGPEPTNKASTSD